MQLWHTQHIVYSDGSKACFDHCSEREIGPGCSKPTLSTVQGFSILEVRGECLQGGGGMQVPLCGTQTSSETAKTHKKATNMQKIPTNKTNDTTNQQINKHARAPKSTPEPTITLSPSPPKKLFTAPPSLPSILGREVNALAVIDPHTAQNKNRLLVSASVSVTTCYNHYNHT